MKLHLIRHAKTEKESSTGRDFDRKLKASGEQDALDLGTYLKSIGFNPVKTLCSTAMRTRQTKIFLSKNLDLGEVTYLDELYMASEQQMREIIGKCRSENELLIVGHNDGISELASYLTGQWMSLPTCAYVCIEFFIDEWKEISKDTGMIIDFYRPQ